MPTLNVSLLVSIDHGNRLNKRRNGCFDTAAAPSFTALSTNMLQSDIQTQHNTRYRVNGLVVGVCVCEATNSRPSHRRRRRSRGIPVTNTRQATSTGSDPVFSRRQPAARRRCAGAHILHSLPPPAECRRIYLFLALLNVHPSKL